MINSNARKRLQIAEATLGANSETIFRKRAEATLGANSETIFRKRADGKTCRSVLRGSDTERRELRKFLSDLNHPGLHRGHAEIRRV